MPPPTPDEAPDPSASVRAEYEQRREAQRARAGRSGAAARRTSNARLAVFLLALAWGWGVFGDGRLPGWTLALPALAFVILVVRHDRLLRRTAAAERAAAWYDDGLARLDGSFAGRGNPGERFRDPHHPYADDLDLFGRGSLFELLCRARTTAGEDTLAAWLLAPAAAAGVRTRQEAAIELRDALDLREELALVGERVAAGLHAETLAAWGEAAPPAPPVPLRIAAFGLSLASAGLLAGVVWGVPLLVPWLFVLAVSAGFAAGVRRRVQRVLRETDAAVRDLGLLAELLAILERLAPRAARLADLRDQVSDPAGVPASRAIARLGLLAQLLDARRNQLFAPIGAMLLFTTQVAFAVDAWRARHGPKLRRWIEAVGELEALASLAGQAYEHPGDAWPELLETGEPRFEARGAGHPLLAVARSVRNDVRLDPALRVLVVSGSNMSGKSTLLRTVGSNAVLALAGAPVRAEALRLAPLAIGASIRLNDSLHEGHSRFYAEIRRLRQIVDATGGALPVLFLLDEVLHGTNSHDRRIGAEAVVRSLVARGAIGLVTTHDLALAKLADSPALHAANVHFEDALVDGQMHFDYRMRPGVVTRSNAIALMRAVGLEV